MSSTNNSGRDGVPSRRRRGRDRVLRRGRGPAVLGGPVIGDAVGLEPQGLPELLRPGIAAEGLQHDPAAIAELAGKRGVGPSPEALTPAFAQDEELPEIDAVRSFQVRVRHAEQSIPERCLRGFENDGAVSGGQPAAETRRNVPGRHRRRTLVFLQLPVPARDRIEVSGISFPASHRHQTGLCSETIRTIRDPVLCSSSSRTVPSGATSTSRILARSSSRVSAGNGPSALGSKR